MELAGWRRSTPRASGLRKALQSGKSVVTANKLLIAEHGTRLQGTGSRGREAAARIRRIGCWRDPGNHRNSGRGLAGDRLFKIAGVLNGTCNFILTKMGGDRR